MTQWTLKFHSEMWGLAAPPSCKKKNKYYVRVDELGVSIMRSG